MIHIIEGDWSHMRVHKKPLTMEKLTVFIVLLCFACYMAGSLAAPEKQIHIIEGDWSHLRVHKKPLTMEKLTAFIVLLCFACYMAGSLAEPEGKMVVKRQNPVALIAATYGPLAVPALALGGLLLGNPLG
ncbi:hypothetical protein RRG08_040803 [Elysia crispata]|uniref:Uncharacterized protein n=1 Tax=Elysia crispata TaxID=231223 RepID=A0AAE1BF94_9GAST|nr:hypothetical protein RRG08_040803 [Elysia crispata]